MGGISSASKENELILINIYEEFVKPEVKKTIKDFGGCSCDTCFLDACALALNALPPKYVSTTRGEMLTKITTTEVGNNAAIIVAVTNAVMQVMKNPRHQQGTDNSQI